ncbi:1216_t:CDS:2 [Acaulospora colombiana]|uniref:1216_t:CDS:1 n=1 Tax=Acaulospora colombiana TaxID=27376 RepID=A0ACA9NYD6_9GLOM|nr:1216_t:CDS:2 [Acaulospora colombiana]
MCYRSLILLQGRMRWLQELAMEAGGEQTAEDLVKGRGISLILKKIDLDFKLLIAHKFVPHSKDPAHLLMHAVAYSNTQERVVTESNAVCVWYDYDNLRKASQGPPSHFARVIERSMKGGGSEQLLPLSEKAST